MESTTETDPFLIALAREVRADTGEAKCCALGAAPDTAEGKLPGVANGPFVTLPLTPPAGLGCRKQSHEAALAEQQGDPERLWNSKVVDGSGTSQVRQQEQPHHRAMLLMRARGFTVREIAQTLGYTDSTVSIALRQPHAVKMLTSLLMEAGRPEIDALFASEAVASIQTLVEVRDSVDAKCSTRVTAANALLDRYLGKPIAHVETTHKDALPVDVAELERQLATLKSEEGRLRAN